MIYLIYVVSMILGFFSGASLGLLIPWGLAYIIQLATGDKSDSGMGFLALFLAVPYLAVMGAIFGFNLAKELSSTPVDVNYFVRGPGLQKATPFYVFGLISLFLWYKANVMLVPLIPLKILGEKVVSVFSKTTSVSSAPDAEEGEGRSEWIVIVPSETLLDVVVDGKKILPLVPTMDQVKEVEIALSAHLKARHPQLFQKWLTYYRQYTGYQIAGGQKIIRGNFLCWNDDERWKKEWVFVFDGGDCYFNFAYDLDKKEIFQFRVNGEA